MSHFLLGGGGGECLASCSLPFQHFPHCGNLSFPLLCVLGHTQVYAGTSVLRNTFSWLSNTWQIKMGRARKVFTIEVSKFYR
jgi:hypothetical protein